MVTSKALTALFAKISFNTGAQASIWLSPHSSTEGCSVELPNMQASSTGLPLQFKKGITGVRVLSNCDTTGVKRDSNPPRTNPTVATTNSTDAKTDVDTKILLELISELRRKGCSINLYDRLPKISDATNRAGTYGVIGSIPVA